MPPGTTSASACLEQPDRVAAECSFRVNGALRTRVAPFGVTEARRPKDGQRVKRRGSSKALELEVVPFAVELGGGGPVISERLRA